MKMVLVRRKGYDVPSTIPEPLLPNKPPVLLNKPSVPPLLPHSSFPTATAPDDGMTTGHLPTLPTLQHQQLKSQTLPVGMKPVTSSKYPTQLPLLPPPSRRQFTRTNTGGTVDSPVRHNGNDDQVNSPTDQGSSRTTAGLLHSNWPSSLTSDCGKPLKFDNKMESTVPLPPTPTDAYCSIDNSNVEKNHLVATGNNNKHKTSAPPAIDLGPKPVQLTSSELPVKQLNETPGKTKSKKPIVPVAKDDSNDEETFDSDEDETSALYAVVKPRAKGKGESKTHKHSTLRSSNSFKKHKPKPPPKPEPYNASKYKKKSSSPTPVPFDMATTESGHVDASSHDIQEVTVTSNATTITATGDQAKLEAKESSIAVDDPSALYAKVIKKKPSMDLMEPVPLGQDVVPLEQVLETNVLPSIAIEKDDEVNATTTMAATSNGGSSSEVTGYNVTNTSDTIDGHHHPVQLISMTRVGSDSTAITTDTTTTTTATATRGSEAKPIPMPRKKHHRSSSLDLNKMFQKRTSAEQLGKNVMYHLILKIMMFVLCSCFTGLSH